MSIQGFGEALKCQIPSFLVFMDLLVREVFRTPLREDFKEMLDLLKMNQVTLFYVSLGIKDLFAMTVSQGNMGGQENINVLNVLMKGRIY